MMVHPNSFSSQLISISFDEIFIFWNRHLWPGRVSVIEPVSCINSNGQIDINLNKYIPEFFGLYLKEQLVAAMSLCATAENETRARGICVHPDFRGQGLAKLVFDFAINSMQKKENQMLWTMARRKNLEFYQKLGFQVDQEIQGYEFGPHQIMKQTVVSF